MRRLSQEEQVWLVNRLKVYEIKYTEIYAEIYDHMVSGIEARRDQGDTWDISPIFQDIIDEDFGSYRGIERMTKERVSTIRHILFGCFKRAFVGYFTFQNTLILVGGVILGTWLISMLHLPNRYILLTLFLQSLVPIVYLLIFDIRHKTFRKKSIVTGYMYDLSSHLMLLLNMFLYLLPFVLLFFMRDVSDINAMREALFGLLGAPGMSLLMVLMAVYTKTIVNVIQTDYRTMVPQA